MENLIVISDDAGYPLGAAPTMELAKQAAINMVNEMCQWTAHRKQQEIDRILTNNSKMFLFEEVPFYTE